MADSIKFIISLFSFIDNDKLLIVLLFISNRIFLISGKQFKLSFKLNKSLGLAVLIEIRVIILSISYILLKRFLIDKFKSSFECKASIIFNLLFINSLLL